MNLAFIGLGIMGSRMAKRMLAENKNLTVYNRSKDPVRELENMGAKAASSPAEAVKNADIVFSMLSQPEVVEKLALGEDGFLNAMKKNAIWVDCSTVNPSFSRSCSEKAQAKNIRFVDAPVAGSKIPAENGELVFLIGGEKDSVDRAMPYLQPLGKKHLHLGGVGAGTGMKMLINQLLANSLLAFSEVVQLGRTLGFEESNIFDVLLSNPVAAPVLSAMRPRMENQDYTPNFPLKWMNKDLNLVAKTAEEQGFDMPLQKATKEIFARAEKEGYGDKDFAAIYEFLKNGRK